MTTLSQDIVRVLRDKELREDLAIGTVLVASVICAALLVAALAKFVLGGLLGFLVGVIWVSFVSMIAAAAVLADDLPPEGDFWLADDE